MKQCSLCGKRSMVGRNVSHAQNRTPRVFGVNIQKVTMQVDGQKLSGIFCTKCIKRIRFETKATGKATTKAL